MNKCYQCNCEGTFKVEYTKEGEVCVECFQENKIQQLESELKNRNELIKELEAVAVSWQEDYDKLKAKYEPEIVVLNEVEGERQ